LFHETWKLNKEIPRPIKTLPSSLENLTPSYTKTRELNKDLCHKENNEVSKSIPVPITKSIKETRSNIIDFTKI
jgi:hypothetical protein